MTLASRRRRHTDTESTAPPRPTARQRLRRSLAVTTTAAVLAVGGVALTPSSAQASVGTCGSGRCTLYLSKSETAALGRAKIPAPPITTPPQLRAAYYALAYSHVYFASQYAKWGWCSGFRLSIYPWESQGYFGYACNWN